MKYTTSQNPSSVLIVGASLAGFCTARALREQGFEGRITLIGAEEHPPYDRPPLSKQILSGAWQLDDSFFVQSPADHIEMRLGTVASRLEPAERRIVLNTGDKEQFDALVLATGGSPRTLPRPAPSGVHVLRTLDDSLAIRRELMRGGPLTVVGGGFIGAEVASVARTMGIDVTIVESLPALLSASLGPEVGRLCTRLHQEHGVTVRSNVSVEGLEGSPRVQRLRLSDGTSVRADTVVVGIGVIPNVDWLHSSGVPLHDGVVCDAYCCVDQTTRVYAAGDVSRWFNPRFGCHMRVEHWTNAVEQAAQVAHNIINAEEQEPYAPLPYFWSDQYDAKFQLVGWVAPKSIVEVVTSSVDRHKFVAIYSVHDRLSAAMASNWPRAIATCRRIIGQGGTVNETMDSITELS